MCRKSRTCLFIVLYLVFLLPTGCSVQEKYWSKVAPIFLSEEAKQHIKSTKVVVSLDEDKRLGIPVLGQRTSHQYYGVIGKLAESGMLRFPNDLSEQHRQLLRSIDMAAYRFDTNIKFRDEVQATIGAIDWLKVSSVVDQRDVQISDIETMVQTLDEDILLLIDTRYLMSIDFSSISVLSYVTLYAHEETLAKMAKQTRPYEDPPTLYKNLFSYEFRYAGSYINADEALKGWSKDDGEMVRRALAESITDLTGQIVNDFSYTTSK